MKPGAPDPDMSTNEPRSLAQHAARGLARLRPGEGDWRVAALAGALIAAGPVLTIGAAHLLTRQTEREAMQLRDRLAPRIAADRTAAEARALLRATVRRPGLGSTLEALARVLPADAQVVRAQRTSGGVLALDIAAADPDALRAAVRRAPQFTNLRDSRQQRVDSGMVVSMRSTPE